jgi:hypothetical protein
MEKRPEILRILEEIRTTEYSTVGSIDLLLDYGFKMAAYTSFSGEAMAEAKELLHDARRKGLDNIDTLLKHRAKIGPMLVKDYINDICSKENSYFTLCERCNRACTHAGELVRTAVSALKEEIKMQAFQNQGNNY